MTLRQFWYRYVYYHSPAWKITRWLRKKKCCQECGGRGALHLHHEDYNGYYWWNLLLPDLVSKIKTLCVRCHWKKHRKK